MENNLFLDKKRLLAFTIFLILLVNLINIPYLSIFFEQIIVFYVFFLLIPFVFRFSLQATIFYTLFFFIVCCALLLVGANIIAEEFANIIYFLLVYIFIKFIMKVRESDLLKK